MYDRVNIISGKKRFAAIVLEDHGTHKKCASQKHGYYQEVNNYGDDPISMLNIQTYEAHEVRPRMSFDHIDIIAPHCLKQHELFIENLVHIYEVIDRASKEPYAHKPMYDYDSFYDELKVRRHGLWSNMSDKLSREIVEEYRKEKGEVK